MHSNSYDKYSSDDKEVNGNDEYKSWKKYKDILLKYLES